MLMAQLGDILVIMTGSQSLDKDDPIRVHYTLFFRDLATGKTGEISYEGRENDACLGFAAWIASDEKNIGVLEKPLAELREKLPAGFLP